MKVVVIRSERGRITEKSVVEGKIEDIVKDAARKALEEWDPANSDFIAIKDLREVELDLPLNPDLVDFLREYGSLHRVKDKAVVRIPTYTISFDNVMVSEDRYIENKIYLIAPYINDDLTVDLESMAAEYTAEKTAAPGIEEEA